MVMENPSAAIRKQVQKENAMRKHFKLIVLICAALGAIFYGAALKVQREINI